MCDVWGGVGGLKRVRRGLGFWGGRGWAEQGIWVKGGRSRGRN